jgi:hypothetical protein
MQEMQVVIHLLKEILEEMQVVVEILLQLEAAAVQEELEELDLEDLLEDLADQALHQV